jgi:hypothetical protein
MTFQRLVAGVSILPKYMRIYPTLTGSKTPTDGSLTLCKSNYSGWIVVEAEQDQYVAHPLLCFNDEKRY